MALPESVRRVIDDATAKGLALAVVETSGSRSAAEAAAEVGTSVARIVKSLLFRGARTGSPFLLLVSGVNQVDEAGMEAILGEALERPDADFVRDVTGFAIGGVSPFGATTAMPVLMDESLFAHPTVWAAAGTPRHVFECVPLQLRSATGAIPVRIA
jgi:prolyl-tRNA editing enzyme YbaK/EbsC (Cys-tRNA(Pro) deacylase)